MLVAGGSGWGASWTADASNSVQLKGKSHLDALLPRIRYDTIEEINVDSKAEYTA